MRFSAVLLLVGILAVGVFGFTGMNPGMDHQSGCIASLVNVVACPLQGISSAIYHMSAYASFSQAVFSLSLILLALILLALLAATLGRLKLATPKPVPISRIAHSRLDEDSYTEKQLLWLSRFENSPSVYCSA